ncbi:MAG: hypothetical protein U9N36_03030 [Euryarchaeota archaeon]|nr:hypothetical protein [Euryarchaeota archaeon]
MKELKKARMGIIALILVGIMLLMTAVNVSAEIDPDKLLPHVSKEMSQRQVYFVPPQLEIFQTSETVI